MQTVELKDVGAVSKRITVIDAMRGIALIGICLTHAMQYFGGFPSSPVPEPFAGAGSLDEAARWFINYFVASKFYIIFSFLFGMSFFIQMDRAAEKGIDFRPRFFWRLFLLLVIGILHSMVFSLDILVIYALLGFPLVFMFKLPTKLLVGLACFFMLGGVQLGVVAYNSLNTPEPALVQAHEQPRSQPARSYEASSLGETARRNLTSGLERKLNYQVKSGRIFMTMGLFIMGLVVGRKRLFQNLDNYRKALYLSAAVAVVGLAALYILRPYIPPGDPDTLRGWISMPVTNTINLLTAYLWVASIIWAYRSEKVRNALRPVVSYGRMGLTNYVVQSVVGVFIFYGFGLGLNNYLGVFPAILVCAGYTMLQIWGSDRWLKSFRYGPLEWLWRSGTYLRWQPLRR